MKADVHPRARGGNPCHARQPDLSPGRCLPVSSLPARGNRTQDDRFHARTRKNNYRNGVKKTTPNPGRHRCPDIRAQRPRARGNGVISTIFTPNPGRVDNLNPNRVKPPAPLSPGCRPCCQRWQFRVRPNSWRPGPISRKFWCIVGRVPPIHIHPITNESPPSPREEVWVCTGMCAVWNGGQAIEGGRGYPLASRSMVRSVIKDEPRPCRRHFTG